MVNSTGYRPTNGGKKEVFHSCKGPHNISGGEKREDGSLGSPGVSNSSCKHARSRSSFRIALKQDADRALVVRRESGNYGQKKEKPLIGIGGPFSQTPKKGEGKEGKQGALEERRAKKSLAGDYEEKRANGDSRRRISPPARRGACKPAGRGGGELFVVRG